MMFTTKNGIRLSVTELNSLIRARYILDLLAKHADTDLSKDAEFVSLWMTTVIEKADHKKKTTEPAT